MNHLILLVVMEKFKTVITGLTVSSPTKHLKGFVGVPWKFSLYISFFISSALHRYFKILMFSSNYGDCVFYIIALFLSYAFAVFQWEVKLYILKSIVVSSYQEFLSIFQMLELRRKTWKINLISLFCFIIPQIMYSV